MSWGLSLELVYAPGSLIEMCEMHLEALLAAFCVIGLRMRLRELNKNMAARSPHCFDDEEKKRLEIWNFPQDKLWSDEQLDSAFDDILQQTHLLTYATITALAPDTVEILRARDSDKCSDEYKITKTQKRFLEFLYYRRIIESRG
jgi:hypothetical protein